MLQAPSSTKTPTKGSSAAPRPKTLNPLISRCPAAVKGHRQPLTKLQYMESSYGHSIFSASLDNYMRLWGQGEGGRALECLAMAKGPDGMTQAHALDGGNLAAVAADGGICGIVDIVSGRSVEEMRWNEGTERFQVPKPSRP